MPDTPNIDWGSDDAGFDEEQGPAAPGDAGPHAEDFDHNERPRRIQMNVKIADEVKQAFKKQVEADNREMQFVVEDLLRMYVRDRSS